MWPADGRAGARRRPCASQKRHEQHDAARSWQARRRAPAPGAGPLTRDPDWKADLARVATRRPLLKEQSLWAIWLYRAGRRLDRRRPGVGHKLLSGAYWFLFRILETALGISLPKSVVVGPGLRIWHFGGIFIHADVVIGAGCTLRQGVTIGNRREGGPVPVLGNNVEIGAGAQVLGGVRIGDNCHIGAMSLVLCDVPDGATAVGVPARILPASAVPAPPVRCDQPTMPASTESAT